MDDHVDQQLSRLISDAVTDVEPNDRLAELRERTTPGRTRRGWYAAGGVTLAAAAAVTAIALAANQTTPRADDPGPVATSSPSVSPTAAPGLGLHAAYFVGDTPFGPRLFREFRQATPMPSDVLLLESTPLDPDYRTLWPAGSFGEVTHQGSNGSVAQIDVTIINPALHDRPSGMSEAEAELAIQQVIYTVQAQAKQRAPVQFRFNGNPIDQVLGVFTSEPLTQAPQLDVLALVNISDPTEGRIVDGHFTANGVANSFEGTVPWELQDASGAVVKQGFAMAGMDDHLIPWRTEPIDVSDLEPGSYVFVAKTDDPSDGEGPGPYTDTRTIVVR
jgi:hypothetical protein